MKRARIEGPEYGQVGIIESVTLRNFMCHENLVLRFDPHINFIVGSNGSGKSAIITGIILALGGKAGLTGRYSNIKGFIQTGKHHASVSVRLKNCGPTAYKPDVYGEIITFERHMTVDGASHYKIKTEDGKIMSHSKEELNTILSYMDIQIDNPITILTQEISKSFLVSKNAKGEKLFELFYKGTGLLKIELDYKKCREEKEEAESEVERKRVALPQMEKEVKNIKTLIECSSRVTDLRKELIWANVTEMENNRDEFKEKYLTLKTQSAQMTRKIEEYKGEIALASEDLVQLEEKRAKSEEKMKNLSKEAREFAIKRNELTSELTNVTSSSARFEREFKKLTTDIANIEKVIADNIYRNQNSVNELKMQHEMKLVEIKKTLSTIAEEINHLELERKQKYETLQGIQRNIEACQVEIQDFNSQIRNVDLEKKQLSEGIKNRINMYGSEMNNVVECINTSFKHGQFKEKPKGPIGLHINVKDPRWSTTVQECLTQHLLKSFCCDNHKDAEALGKIIERCYGSSRFKPSIITSKFVNKVFNVEHYKTKCNYPTVLDMLEIDDPVVTNVLIDQKRIENVILIENQNEAVNLMLDNPPRNVSSAYTMHGDLILTSPYRFYPCKNKNQICLLKNLSIDDVNKWNLKIEALNSNIKQKIIQKKTLEDNLWKVTEDMNNIMSHITQSRIKLRHTEMKLKEEVNQYEEPKDINCLAGDLDQLRLEKESKEKKINACNQHLALKKNELNSLDKIVRETENTMKMEYEAISVFAKQINELEGKKENRNARIRDMRSKLKSLTPELQEAKNKYETAIEDTMTATRDAEETCPRIETDRDAFTVKKLLDETNKAMAERRNCDREGLMNQYTEKFERLNKAKHELMRQEAVNTKLGQMIEKRFQEFQQIQRTTAITLACGFTGLLRQNNFSGRPDINFNNETLEIIAKPSNVNRNDKHQLSQLSGGERSYVMIAFLLSLWDRIHMPFRILDEYDVFMDPNNRHLSINLLVNSATMKKNVQYIFLSPLELPPMSNSANIKVHKMAPPKR